MRGLLNVYDSCIVRINMDDILTMKKFLEWDAPFIKDTSPEGEFQANRVSQARGTLYLDMPFFGYILGHFQIFPVDDPRIKTMAIDVRNLYFRPSFLETKPIPEIKGLLMHLVLHMIMKHMDRGAGRNTDIWGMASDISANLMLDEIKRENRYEWKIPDVSKYRNEFGDLSTDEIYNILFDEASEQQGEGENNNEGGFSDDILQAIADKHGVPKECDFNQSLKEMQLIDASELLDLQKERFEGILRASYQMNKDKGNLPLGLKEMIEAELNPKVPWQTLLEHYIQRTLMVDWKWNPPNKRMMSYDYHFPSAEKEYMDVVVAVDTSGSISSVELSNFVSEVYGILASVTRLKLTLIDCDAAIQQVSVFENGESIDGSKLPWEGREFKGRGGTDFIPVFEYVLENGLQPDLLVYFTDGYGSFPDQSQIPIDYPVLWVMTTSVEPPFGEFIRYDPL
ncbi:MAG: hypothetical protein D6732_22905 [Methanobacteriota archaeon]|nr:MAG: hypothetical protein D6732_22905 [Euryarchaeota archaeon]